MRYILRKVFNLVDASAKRFGLEGLEHQALIQVYGSDSQELRVGDLAERLNIASAFASNLTKGLTERGLMVRAADPADARAIRLQITDDGRELCDRIDDDVRGDVEYFTKRLTADEQETAFAILMFYVGWRKA